MPDNNLQSRELFTQLKPGEPIEVEHQITVGRRCWTSRTVGRVVRVDRVRQGLHFRRNFDDQVFSDAIILERPDGERTTITLDEFTSLRRVG